MTINNGFSPDTWMGSFIRGWYGIEDESEDEDIHISEHKRRVREINRKVV